MYFYLITEEEASLPSIIDKSSKGA